MTSDRIKEIQETTAYPESLSVKQALLQVWNECAQERMYTEEQLCYFAGYCAGAKYSHPDMSISDILEEWKESLSKRKTS